MTYFVVFEFAMRHLLENVDAAPVWNMSGCPISQSAWNMVDCVRLEYVEADFLLPTRRLEHVWWCGQETNSTQQQNEQK